MTEKLTNRRIGILSIALIIDMDSDGNDVYSALVNGHDNDDIVVPVSVFECAAEAARAAATVWTSKAEPEGKVD